MAVDVQRDSEGRLRHLLMLEGLPRELLLEILNRAQIMQTFKAVAQPNRALINLFFENSTRTRFSFELAAQRLGIGVLNFDVQHSSIAKGETLGDTIRTLTAISPDILVVRHGTSGMVARIAGFTGGRAAVINAGDGYHAHPTQALLDLFTMRERFPDFGGLSVAIVGDVRHSRVARSLLVGLRTLGVQDLRVIGSPALLPDPPDSLNAQPFTDLRTGLAGINVVVALRLQIERMARDVELSDGEAFHSRYGLTEERMAAWAAPGALLMHPGPINRDIELSGELADGERSLILRQVANGVAVRMAVIETLVNNLPDRD